MGERRRREKREREKNPKRTAIVSEPLAA